MRSVGWRRGAATTWAPTSAQRCCHASSTDGNVASSSSTASPRTSGRLRAAVATANAADGTMATPSTSPPNATAATSARSASIDASHAAADDAHGHAAASSAAWAAASPACSRGACAAQSRYVMPSGSENIGPAGTIAGVAARAGPPAWATG